MKCKECASEVPEDYINYRGGKPYCPYCNQLMKADEEE